MALKRSYEDAVQDGLPTTNGGTADTCHDDHSQGTSNGKQRRLSTVDADADCATASTSARPKALPSTSRARFVPGLQTFVGGLQMSQGLAASSSSTPSPPLPLTTRRSLDAPDAMQPLMMSRNRDSERRSSQGALRRRSQEALEEALRRPSRSIQDEAQLVPGVSPGWHVEAHGRQAMELQDGVRFQDEAGWTPLDAFPAATRQGKLAVRRFKPASTPAEAVQTLPKIAGSAIPQRGPLDAVTAAHPHHRRRARTFREHARCPPRAWRMSA
ncbi:hypothetical protein L1887_49884 [Cichorium endivia]|nr:hypothetical protein L1887_49884 [Cichorium endivia]